MLNSFFVEIYKFWLSRIISSLDFIIPLIIFFVVSLLECKFQIKINVEYDKILSVLVWIFAFSFGALAIIVWFFDKNFSLFIKKTNFYEEIIFHYYYGISIFLFSTVFLSWFMILNLKWFFQNISIFLFLYCIFLSYEILKITINLWKYKQKYFDYIEKIEKDTEIK